MAHALTVNTTRSNLSTALVSGLTQPYSPSEFLSLSFGETVDVELFLIDGDSYDTRSGLAGYTPRVAITLDNLKPQDGTFTLSDDSESTSPLDWDATAAEVESALNALNSGSGPFGDLVTVQKFVNGTFSIKFATAGNKNLLAVEADGLEPPSSGSVVPLVEGDVTTKEQQFVQIKADPLVFANGGTEITNGWRITLDANNANFLQAVASGDISADYSIQLVA